MVKTGLDVFIDKKGGPWRGKRLGLIVHQASVTSRLEPAVDALRRRGLTLAALFAPEHGLAGALQDQVAVGPSRDAATGLPVHSLYGDPADPAQKSRLSPSAESLADVDALLFDLQDIGVR